MFPNYYALRFNYFPELEILIFLLFVCLFVPQPTCPDCSFVGAWDVNEKNLMLNGYNGVWTYDHVRNALAVVLNRSGRLLEMLIIFLLFFVNSFLPQGRRITIREGRILLHGVGRLQELSWKSQELLVQYDSLPRCKWPLCRQSQMSD